MSEQPSETRSSLDLSSSQDEFSGVSEQQTTQESAEETSNILSAIPPTVSVSFTGATVEDLDTPALACIEELQARGKLDGEHAAKLKKKYTELHETLKRSHANETELVNTVKELSQRLVQQKTVLDRADNFPGGQTTEVTQLRQELLQYNNELAEIDERMEKQQYEIQTLNEEKQLLEKEYKRIPNPVEEAKKLQDLQTECNDLREETERRVHEMTSIRDEIEQKRAVIKDIQLEVAELVQSEGALKDDLARLHTVPGNIPKEMDSIRRHKLEIESKLTEMAQFVAELHEEISRQQNLKDKAETQCREVTEKLQSHKRAEEARHLEMSQLNVNLEKAKEREATLLEDKAQLELQLRHRSSEYRMFFDMVNKRTREKNKEMKILKKSDLQLNVIRDSYKEFEAASKKVVEKNEETKLIMEAAKQKGEDMRNSVDTLRRHLTQQESLEEGVRLRLEHQQREERQLKLQVQHQRDYLHNCARDNVAMTKLRDQEGHNLRKALDQQKEFIDTIKTRNGMIEENRKKVRELEMQLQDFAKAYEVVKGERNKTHTLIQTTTQLVAEMYEKSKILDNEIEILRSSVASKDRLLQKCSIAYSNKVMERDSFHQELSRYKLSQLELEDIREQQRREIQRLNNLINTVEHQMIRLRKRYERAVQERNDQGLQLIERNEEVCIFYERINVQDLVVRKADIELKSREEEIRFLNMELNEISRELEVLQKLEPQKQSLTEQLKQSQTELSQVHDHLTALEKAMETDLSRARSLSGVDPNTGQLRVAMEKAEERLATVEECILEKELLYEQVSRLTEWVQKQVNANKTETLQLAKKVNSYQAQIRDATRKLKALVSELSMYQAKSIEFDQDVKVLNLKLEQAYARLEQGEPPDEECQKEWLKMLQQLQLDYQQKAESLEDKQWMLPNGTYTTAEPRPNSYIPQTDNELPIAKPYGAKAPFKPTLPGANIRHIQKPKPKPIEI